MTDPSVATLTLTLLQVLIGLGALALVVGVVAVGTLLTPAPAERSDRSGSPSRATPCPATAH
jgi:hypothetical protein